MRFSVSVAFGFLLACAPGMAWAAWLEGHSRNFAVYSDGSEDELRVSIARLENQDRLLRRLTRLKTSPSAAPLKVYLVANRQKLREVEAVSPAAYGLYSTKVGGTALIAVRSGRPGLGGEDILRHEYTHHFMMRHQPAYYPLWYAEGFAEYFMTAAVDGDRAELGRSNPARLAALLRGTWLPVERLLFEPRLTAEETRQFYAASWLLVHYLNADETRRAALENYLQALGRGAPARPAFRQAFGHEAEQLNADLRRHLESGPASYVLALDAAPAPDAAIRALPASAEELLPPHLAMTLAEPHVEKPLLERIRREGERAPDDPYVRRVLGRAEISFGDRQEGVRLVDLLLQDAPQDPELLYLRGLADYLTGRSSTAARAARFATARHWFERALEADPAYYTAAYRLAECELLAGGAQGIEHLLLAQSQAPMVSEIALNAATILSRRGQHDHARRVLTPIAANPQWRSGRQARELLEKMPGGSLE